MALRVPPDPTRCDGRQEEAPAGDDDAKGVEMEGDFEGSLHDLPPDPEVGAMARQTAAAP